MQRQSTMGSTARFVVFLALLTVLSCIQTTMARCPPPSTIKSSRTCLHDKECYPQICCPDYLGRKSCTYALAGSRNDNPNNKAGAVGVNCGGIKCMPYEVCKPDPITGRLRCQRA